MSVALASNSPAEPDPQRLHLALSELAANDPSLAATIALKWSEKLNEPEIAARLGISTRDVKRNLCVAYAFLQKRIGP